MTTNEKPAGGEPAGNDKSGGESNEFSTNNYTLPVPSLSRESLKNLSDLAGELSDFYLEKCHALIDRPDPVFNESFSQLIVCLDLQDIYLRRLQNV